MLASLADEYEDQAIPAERYALHNTLKRPLTALFAAEDASAAALLHRLDAVDRVFRKIKATFTRW